MAGQQICVFCHKHPIDPMWRPFCSERCKILDLARWVDATYRVPSDSVSSDESSDDTGDE